MRQHARIHRGFVLESTYRIEAGTPVVLVYGKLESGRPFLVRDDRQIPSFYVRACDAPLVRDRSAAVEEINPPKHTMAGEPVVRVRVHTPQDVPPLRDTLVSQGIPCYEADIAFATRYLIDRGVRGAISIEGAPRQDDGNPLAFDNPEVTGCDSSPPLSILSFDIETDPAAKRLLSIALAGCGINEVLLFTPRGYKHVDAATCVPGEKELLQLFMQRIRDLDPDILTGWNVVDFDIATLIRIGERCGVPLILGRGAEQVRLRPRQSYSRGSSTAYVQGRVVLDGIHVLRNSFVRLESYSLDSVAREIVGKSKTVSGPRRATEILHMFKEDRGRLVEYNLNDARLVLEILDKLRLVELSVERSRLTGMPLDRVGASIASFDFLYLSELAGRRIVAPSVQNRDAGWGATAGGHVLEPRPGLYRNVLVFDFKSLYPSVIRTFQIDPCGFLPRPTPEEDPIVAPNGAAFRRTPGILPGILDELFPRREKARAAGDSVASHAIKILMNSFYGVLGTPACRFASPELANAITSFGREILLWSKETIERYGYQVLYGDTDSLFVVSGSDTADDARTLGTSLAGRLNTDLADHVSRRWRVESRLEIKFERLYLRFLLPAARHSAAGARKRYAGLVENEGKREVVFTGMEAVRSDWTDLAREAQRELYTRLFCEQPVEEYVREMVARLRAGELDRLLVYRKALRKGLAEYTASTPPHVSAARKGTPGRAGQVISYVVTRNGPEPAEARSSPIDYEHYVDKQLRAVAEPVFVLLGLDFDSVAARHPQLRLF
jgi:DNA polymerase II